MAQRWANTMIMVRTALVADVMTREWARVITGARPEEAGFATVRERRGRARRRLPRAFRRARRTA